MLAATGVVLGAWYLLTMLRRVFFGPVKDPSHGGHGPTGDLNARELAALVPVAVLCVVLGVYPQPFLEIARPDIETVATLADLAQPRAGAAVARNGSGAPLPAVRAQSGEEAK